MAKRIFIKQGMPLHIVFFVTSRCSLRCRHCYYSNRLNNSDQELTIDEIAKIARSLPHLLSISFSGGEPFARKDLYRIVELFLTHCRPKYIQFPTNGLLTADIIATLEKVLEASGSARVIVNLSIDGTEDIHDAIRGRKGSFKKCLETMDALKRLKRRYPALSIYTATTCMSENENNLQELFDLIVKDMEPENIGINLVRSPVAEEALKDLDINNYKRFYESKRRYMKSRRLGLRERIVLAKELMESEFIADAYSKGEYSTPCYAANLFGLIDEKGEVFPCLLRDNSLGSLRDPDIGYDMKRIWSSKRASKEREDIRKQRCYCTYECCMTTSILFNIKNLSRLAFGLARIRF